MVNSLCNNLNVVTENRRSEILSRQLSLLWPAINFDIVLFYVVLFSRGRKLTELSFLAQFVFRYCLRFVIPVGLDSSR